MGAIITNNISGANDEGCNHSSDQHQNDEDDISTVIDVTVGPNVDVFAQWNLVCIRRGRKGKREERMVNKSRRILST